MQKSGFNLERGKNKGNKHLSMEQLKSLSHYEKIKEEIGIQITVINPRFLTGLDIELLEKLKKNHTHILTLEDGELVSGYGQNIASYYGDSDIKVKNYGISKVFHTDYDPIELLAQNGMSVENLSQYIQENI